MKLTRYQPFPRVKATYGAPMGRRGEPLENYDGKSPLLAQHCGGDGYYDKGGAYWGHSNVFAVYTRGGGFCAYVKATDRIQALYKVRFNEHN